MLLKLGLLITLNLRIKLASLLFIKRTKTISTKGYDPEVILISTKDAIFIVYRGTDSVGDDLLAEWTGTDFKIGMVEGDGALKDIKIHKGFWGSFVIMRNELIDHLKRLDGKNKKIWITGHSLGGAMSILSAAYLEGFGFPIQNVYTYASPRAIGGKKFMNKVDELLPNKIQRFEYFLDPIAMLWTPPYKNNGKRNWYESAEKGNYKLHLDTKERYISTNPTEFNRVPFFDKRSKEDVRLHRQRYNAFMTDSKMKVHFHNSQWYVKAAYAQLTEEEKKRLPSVDDSYPFLYYGASFGK